MKEKVILIRPNGESEERKVVAYFKTSDDSKPNIKDIPILILDRNEMNNGNNVLEFMWQKDGVYQAINEENAWTEVKSVVVDIIKNNAKNISYVKDESVKCDIGFGRSLGLTVAQTDALTANFKMLVNSEVSNESLIVENPINVSENVVKEVAPQVDSFTPPTMEEQINKDVIMPFASDAPAIENVINETQPQEPVVSDGPEIVSENKETDFDKMQKEIELATIEYQEKINNIVNMYKKKITETINEANILKQQANDHLKNAQAAEQIATMAYQNSMGASEQAPSLGLQKIA